MKNLEKFREFHLKWSNFSKNLKNTTNDHRRLIFINVNIHFDFFKFKKYIKLIEIFMKRISCEHERANSINT